MLNDPNAKDPNAQDVPKTPTVEETVQRALAAQRAELEADKAKALEALRAEQTATLAELAARHSTELEVTKAKAAAATVELAKLVNDDRDPPSTEPPPRPRPRPEAPAEGAVFITREMLVKVRACQLDTFHARVGDEEGFWWTPAEVQRLYKLSPRYLRFYEYRGLVPMLEAEGVPSVAERQAELDAIRERQAERRAALRATLGLG